MLETAGRDPAAPRGRFLRFMSGLCKVLTLSFYLEALLATALPFFMAAPRFARASH